MARGQANIDFREDKLKLKTRNQLNQNPNRVTKEGRPREKRTLVWDDIGPVKNPLNITGDHKSSAVWVGKIAGQKVIVKLPGAKITAGGDLFLSSYSPSLGGNNTTPERSLRAELLVHDLLSILGKEWSDIFADVSLLIPEEGFLAGEKCLLVEYIEGENIVDHYAKENPLPKKSLLGLTEEEKAAINKLWTDNPEERKALAADARKILLIDLITMNEDRHDANFFWSEGRLRAYDQGMAFGSDRYKKHDLVENAILAHTGGSDLKKEEREALITILSSDWLERVKEEMGEEYFTKITERILWILEADKIYCHKARFDF